MISSTEVNQFLQAYVSSFEDFSGATMAAHYHMPSVMTRSDSSVHCFSAIDSTRAALSVLVKAYFDQGAREWRYEDLEVVPIGNRSVLASVDWLMLDDQGALLKRWRHSYNLVDSADGLKILAATFNVP
jgi:hypothetical protein